MPSRPQEEIDMVYAYVALKIGNPEPLGANREVAGDALANDGG